MRYTPKALKSWPLIKFIKRRIATTATRNAEIIATARIPICEPVRAIPASTNFKILRQLAQNIIGIAIKKEYSAATSLETPKSMAPRMVAPA